DLKAHFFARPAASNRCRAQGLSRLAVAPTSPHMPAMPGHTWTAPSTTARSLWSGMTMSRGARLWRTDHRAATLYSVGRNDPDHDAVLRIGSEAPRRQAHSAQRHESHGFCGTPPPRTVIGDPSPWCGSSRNCQAIGDVHSIVRVHHA